MFSVAIMPGLRLRRIGLFLILFLSGVAGLGYQVVWTRMFTTGLGHEIAAVLAVVTAFFGGLALGAGVLDRPISRSPSPGRWYALLEWVIGLWAFASVLLIPLANHLALGWIRSDPSALRQWLVTFVVPFMVLLPATVAMGATLPAMERVIAPLTGDGRCVGALYAANTIGAVVGVMIGAFVLIPLAGHARAVLLLAALNCFCGLAAFALALPSEGKPLDRHQSAGGHAQETGLKGALFLTGLLGIGYEVLGVRALSQVLEGTVYTFAVTLAVYLMGTSTGAALYQGWLRRMRFEPLKSGLLIGLSSACALGVGVLARSQTLYEGLRAYWRDSPAAVAATETAVAAAVFGLPTIFMGAVFSHLTQYSRRRDGGIGQAFALNTLGCALAPMIFGAGLLPVLGIKWAFAVVVFGYLLLMRLRSGVVWAGALVPLVLILLLPSRLQFVVLPPGAKLAAYREGVMDSVAVVEYPDRNRSLLVNARFAMGGTGSAIAERRHAQLPLLLHPDPRRALFLGLGTGITFAAASSHPEIEADAVELVPEVIESLPYFEPFNVVPLAAQRFKIHAADARRFVRCSDVTYDVIVADLFHPARDGAGTLYTLEHFQAIRRRLAPGGLFCQWLPLHQLDESMLKVIIRTFLEVFPDTDAFLLRFNVDTPVVGLVGRLKPLTYPANWLESRVRDPGLQAQLKPLALTDTLQLLGCWLAGPDALRDFTRDAGVNTDDRPVVVFGAPKFYYQRDSTTYGRLLALLDLPGANPGRLVTRDDPPRSDEFAQRLGRFIAARDVYLRGLVAEAGGNSPGAISAYVESARISPDFSTGYARCLTIAMQQSGTDLRSAQSLLERLIEARPDRPVARELRERLNRP